MLTGILGTVKAYPTFADPGLFVAFPGDSSIRPPYGLFTHVYWHSTMTSLIHLHAPLPLPLFNHLWSSQGTGNANFFSGSTLVFGIINGAALMDCVWGGLRIALGEVKEGYEAVQW